VVKDNYVTLMRWGTQCNSEHNFGIVDLQFHCSDGTWHRATNNQNAKWDGDMDCLSEGGFREIIVEDLGGHGLVNAGTFCLRSQIQKTSNSEERGNWSKVYGCPSGQNVVGVQSEEQSMFGMVDFRFECAEAKVYNNTVVD